MPNLSIEQAAYAIYTPAIQPYASLYPLNNDPAAFAARVGDKLALADMNFLTPNPVCHIGYGLYSAGLALDQDKPCSVTMRDRGTTFIIGDSGGFQAIKGKLGPIDNPLRLRVLRWQEKHCDAGHILDVPLKALDFPSQSGFHTFEQCLEATVKGVAYFSDKRENPEFKLMAIFQGRTQADADRWYEAVRQFKVEGYSFAGVMKTNFLYVAKRLLTMAERGEITADTSLHFLGVATPEVAIILTALKRALRNAGFTNLQITFDTSTPFSEAGIYKRAGAGLKFNRDKLTVHRQQLPIEPKECCPTAPFPYNSPIGRRLTMGDLMPHRSGDTGWDEAGWNMLANHNLHVEVASIIQANKIMDVGYRLPGAIPYHVREAVGAIWQIFNTDQPGKYLQKHRDALTSFTSALGDDEDSQR